MQWLKVVVCCDLSPQQPPQAVNPLNPLTQRINSPLFPSPTPHPNTDTPRTMAANQANEHDSDDLYSQDFPELSSQGLLIHDFLEYTSETGANDTEPIEGTIQPAAPSRPPSPEVRMSKEYQRIDYFSRIEYGQRMEDFRRLESQIQYSFETAIERREQNFQKTAMDCLSGIQPHFVGPMGARDLLWLVQFPYLSLRYFQNERRVAGLLSYMDSQVQRMAGSSTAVDNPYKTMQWLRQGLVETYQANYDAALLPLFAYIEDRLLQHIDLQDWTSGERLTLFDPALVEIVIKPSEELYEKASELEHLEMCIASYRFGEVTRWTGT